MKKLMLVCAGLMLFATSAVEAKPNNPNKQHNKAWIAQHKLGKQQEKMQKEQYKAARKQQKEYEKQQRKANRPYDDDDYQYRNYPQQPQQPREKWGLGDILGGVGL